MIFYSSSAQPSNERIVIVVGLGCTADAFKNENPFTTNDKMGINVVVDVDIKKNTHTQKSNVEREQNEKKLFSFIHCLNWLWVCAMQCVWSFIDQALRMMIIWLEGVLCVFVTNAFHFVFLLLLFFSICYSSEKDIQNTFSLKTQTVRKRWLCLGLVCTIYKFMHVFCREKMDKFHKP